MAHKRNLALGFAALASVAIAAVVAVACGSDDGGGGGLTLDSAMGSTCQNPVPLAGAIALSTLPSTPNGLVPLDGNVAVEVPDGAVGLVANANGIQSLALKVGDHTVPIPDSDGVLQAVGGAYPTTPYNVLVFSRAKLTPRATFAGKTVFLADPAGWSIEIRLIDPAGSVVASKSLPRPNSSVEPLDVEVTDGPDQVAALVKLDSRMVLGNPPTADGVDTPISMQIVEIHFANGALNVVENAPETATKDDFATLAAAAAPPPVCPANACGKVIDATGTQTVDCGGCPEGACFDNVCVLPEDSDGGTCTPKPRDVLCPAGSCGMRPDGCGDVLDCGGCGPGLACGLAAAGQCGDPASLIPADAKFRFGDSVCGCFIDATGKTGTVDCPAGQSCHNGSCAP